MIVNVAPLLKESIGAQAEYQVLESPIDPHGDNSGLLEAGAVSIDADITATHTNPGAYLEGEADASLETTCSRCLIPIETPVHADFAEQYYARFGVVAGEHRLTWDGLAADGHPVSSGAYWVTVWADDRRLVHGTTLHGKQFRDEQLRREPLTYYHRSGSVPKPPVEK